MADASLSVPLTAPLVVPREICRDFERASRLEWLDTNHTGAFVMGTVAGLATRRYHGLLIASLRPPADRYSILPRLEETVTLNGSDFALATAQYPGVVTPRGYELLEEFRLDPFPEWRFACGSATIAKQICLLDRRQAVLVNYRVSQACSLRVRLFASFRDYHSLTHRNNALSPQVEARANFLSFHPYSGLPALSIWHNGRFEAHPLWYYRHQYLRELERGLDFEEDLFTPGCLVFELGPEQSVWLLASLDPPSSESVSDGEINRLLGSEKERRAVRSPSPVTALLHRALDQFRVTRYDGQPTLLAGYPWFTDWSRDTLISLPALSQAGFAPSETKAILALLLAERSHGLLPNRFSDSGSEPEYNTADATLWLFVAAHSYLAETQDLSFLRDLLYPAAQDILDWHRRGTFFGIHVDPADGLLWTGEPNSQLTWMDARVDGAPITPRVGKPVEINALWYNALRLTAGWARNLNRPVEADTLEAEAARSLLSFRAAFWNENEQCLFDVVGGSALDASIRPNQLFALALPFPLLDREPARKVLQVVKDKLMTAVGLRTLDPANPAYRPRFEGTVAERDGAYHQGSVWPWLIGPFVAAVLYAADGDSADVAWCRHLLVHLEEQLTAFCLGSVSELYDADPPHRPAGCPAQLWSVAQLQLALRRVAAITSAAELV